MTLLERLPLSKQGNLIRLVTILPSDQFDAEIKCTLACYSLNDYLNFEALSYTWMGAGYTQAISLNDEEFFVVPNVEAALRYLRYQTRERRLWIDSICINQADIDEKNSQVLKMRDIYKCAKRVIVWIGREVEDEDFNNEDTHLTHDIATRNTLHTIKEIFAEIERLALASESKSGGAGDLQFTKPMPRYMSPPFAS